MPRAAKKQPPSRIKYEQTHPTVSCRVSREIYDRLVEARKVNDKSFADILRIGLGKQQVQTKKIDEARKKGYDNGYKIGYAIAKLHYKVTYHCSKCGRMTEVDQPNEKEAIDRYMREHGWSHQECPQ